MFVRTRVHRPPLIRLGPFHIERQINAGGFGQIWYGFHAPTGQPVAMKVITGDLVQIPKYFEQFRLEVQAVARLSHPGIIEIYDYGMLPEEAASASDGKLVSGSPYLIMEYAPHGSLEQWLDQMDWPTARVVLRTLLDALAHAHARGLVHRDLKPANLLLCDGGAGLELRLTDFGIAKLTDVDLDVTKGDRVTTIENAAGTPSYMAPEQFEGRWLDYGPWTDLYALGVMAWQLVCGRLPYRGSTFVQSALLHIREPIPPIDPQFDVPDGLDEWIHRMMEKKPEQRFRCAADALYALERIAGHWTGMHIVLDEPSSASAPALRTQSDDHATKGFSPVGQKTVANEDTHASPPGNSDHGEPTEQLDEGTVLAPEAGPPSGSPARHLLPAGTMFAGKDHLFAGAPGAPPDEATEQTVAQEGGPVAAIEGFEPNDGFGRTLAFDEEAPRSSTSAIPPVPGERTATLPAVASRMTPGSVRMVSKYSDDVPPFDDSLADATAAGARTNLLGAGLGLYGLRTIRLVDRDEQRHQLWELLGSVRSEHAPRVAILRGPSGYGKSRLAEWLCTNAQESGSANVLSTRHDPAEAPTRGLSRLLSRYFRTQGLKPADTTARIQDRMSWYGLNDRMEARGLAEIARLDAAVAASDDGPRIRFATNADRYALLARTLERVARERPIVVFFDDVQWGADSLAFVRFYLERPASERQPVLFVLTAQDEALSTQAAEQAQLDAIAEDPRAHTLRVGPLAADDTRSLVEQLLSLKGALCRMIEDRSGGNPLFAIQLVGDWVSRGMLASENDGFRLRTGATIALPDSLFALWKIRLQQAVNEWSEEDRRALELCAVLGQQLEHDEVNAVLDIADLRLPEDEFAALSQSGLVVVDANGWSFAHAMLRETLLRSVDEDGLTRPMNSYCAEMLVARYRGDLERVARRLARHLLDANRYGEALEPLLMATRERIHYGDFTAAQALLDDHDRATAAIGLAPADRRLLDGKLVRAQAWRQQWELERAGQIAAEVLEVAQAHLNTEAQAEALFILGNGERHDGALESARTKLDRSLHLYAEIEESAGQARVLRALAITAREQSRFEEAERFYEQARAIFEALGDDSEVAGCLYGLGNLARQQRDYDEARRRYSQARDLADRVGNQQQIAEAINGLAELARYQGDLLSAEQMYREALERLETLGSKGTTFPQLNLLLTLVQRKQYGEALEATLELLPSFEERGRVTAIYARVLMLPCAAALGQEELTLATLESLEVSLADTGLLDNDIGQLAELAEEHASTRGWEDIADRARALAIGQWERLGLPDRVGAARQRSSGAQRATASHDA